MTSQTVQGLWWAIKFVSQLQTACMSEKELKHAIRLTHFRGTVCPVFQALREGGLNHETL